jgi:hypothetical protein
MNYNKNFLLSEFFFFNNKLEYDLDIDNNFFLFFLIKAGSCSKLFNHNKQILNFNIFFNFYYLIYYPYYFNDSQFIYNNNDDTNRNNVTLFFDKFMYPIESKIDFLNFDINYLFFKKKINYF